MLVFSVLLLASSALAAPGMMMKTDDEMTVVGPSGRHTGQVFGVRQPEMPAMHYQARGFNSKIMPLSVNRNSDNIKCTVVAQDLVQSQPQVVARVQPRVDPAMVPMVQVPIQARHHTPDYEGRVGMIKDGVFQQGEAASSDPAASARVLQEDTEVNFDGSFRIMWSSDNGINVHEQGEVKHVDDMDVSVRQGEISYVDNDGNQFHLKYVADENGFRVEGDHLPTPPPIPEAIARSLEFIAAHPYVETTTMPEQEEQEQQQQQQQQQHRQPGQSLVDPLPVVEDN